MKIAWFTPLSKESGISKYSKSITDELIKEHVIHLWVAKDDRNLLTTNLKTVRYRSDDDLTGRLGDYDVIIYNIGNNLDFHRSMYEVARKHQGVVILHDFIMHHFFAGYYLHYRSDTAEYLGAIESYYGTEARGVALDCLSGKRPPLWETEEVIHYPLFERAIENAAGVIVHSRFLADRLKETFLGPVGLLYHPFIGSGAPAHRRETSKADLGIPDDKILVVTIGHVNPNKRIDKIIDVLGKNAELANKIVYVVIGACSHRDALSRITSLISRYGLADSVRFLGFQSDEVLNRYLSAADICINLRFPATEGASWSLVEELCSAKPVVVTDTGFYTELPDDCALKVRIDHEEADITFALQRLVQDKGLRSAMGDKGRLFALEHFSTSRYGRDFSEFLRRVFRWVPISDLTDRVSFTLADMSVPEEMSVVDELAERIYELTGNLSVTK